VRVYKLSPSGKEQTLHVFGPGHLVAEAAALAGAPLPATAEAAERSQLLFIPRRAFLDFLEARPALAVGLVEVLSQRLLRFAGLIENLSLRDVPARVAAYLLECRVEQGADEVRLDMSKGRLSTLLGTSPETLSRTLTRLAEAGAIEQMDNRRIRIAAPALLQGLESGETAL
jgi:CRP/FNR family transcriptional regulator